MPRAEAPSWWDDVEEPAPRRAPRATGSEECLSRAHAADFADAFDLDGAFGAPSRRFGREDRVIVLERTPAAPAVQEERVRAEREADLHVAVAEAEPEAPELAAFTDATYDEELLDAAPEVDPETGRKLVRITGRPEATVAPRRLRELEPRRERRSVAQRAASHPDRIALYAVLLGLFLVVLAAASSSAHP
jgi:hypothetical protein